MHLAVGLEGVGWHPAAWREPDAFPIGLFAARYWVDLVREAECGLLDFVTIDDSLVDGPEARSDRVRGRLDAVLVASRVAPLTTNIGVVPTVVVTHTEPFHVSKAAATLDYVSTGRAGWQVRISTSQHCDAVAEAADYVEVVRRLWDSWDDDAEIRDRGDRSVHRPQPVALRTVAAGLHTLQQATGADELVITTSTRDHEDRVRSYGLLAKEWDGQIR